MNHNKIKPIVVIALMAAFAYCTDDDNRSSENPLVGLWEAVDPFGGTPDAGFWGTWVFKNDGSYRLEIVSATIAGSDSGYSSGLYELISDSILVLDVIDHENFSIDDWDTLRVVVTDTMFVSRFIISLNPFQLGGFPISWGKGNLE